MTPYYQTDNIAVYRGDAREILPAIGVKVDHVVTDPPYGLGFMEAGWDQAVPGPEYWQAIKDVCKPGASLLAFGGTRTFHRLTCAIEDAGWEIRDCLMWLHSQGFPKSLDISKAIDKAAGAEREVIGASRSIDCVERGYTKVYNTRAENSGFGTSRTFGLGIPITAPATPEAAKWDGWGTALKPAWEPIILAMKPLDGTFAHNAMTWGVAGMNIDACRIGLLGSKMGVEPQGSSNPGRFPANLLLNEGAAQQLDAQSGTLTSGSNNVRTKPGDGYHGGMGKAGDAQVAYGDSGGASRFFYCPKAAKKERGPGNDHPCVKPVALMEYLLTLLSTPDGGVILDPFAGSGTTALAAQALGRPCVCIELDEHNCEIIAHRLGEN